MPSANPVAGCSELRGWVWLQAAEIRASFEKQGICQEGASFFIYKADTTSVRSKLGILHT